MSLRPAGWCIRALPTRCGTASGFGNSSDPRSPIRHDIHRVRAARQCIDRKGRLMNTAIRVTGVETVIVSVPLDRPVITPIHRITTIDNVLVTVRTDAGLSGIAYLWTFGVERAKVLAAMVADLGGSIAGQSAVERSRIWATLAGDI